MILILLYLLKLVHFILFMVFYTVTLHLLFLGNFLEIRFFFKYIFYVLENFLTNSFLILANLSLDNMLFYFLTLFFFKNLFYVKITEKIDL